MAKENGTPHGKLSEPENFKPMQGDKEFKMSVAKEKGSKAPKDMCHGGEVE